MMDADLASQRGLPVLGELHEAYAVTTLYNQRELETPREKTNVNGGAIALGHPHGMSGIRYLGSTLLEPRRRSGRKAVVGVCTAGGMATAVYVERRREVAWLLNLRCAEPALRPRGAARSCGCRRAME